MKAHFTCIVKQFHKLFVRLNMFDRVIYSLVYESSLSLKTVCRPLEGLLTIAGHLVGDCLNDNHTTSSVFYIREHIRNIDTILSTKC